MRLTEVDYRSVVREVLTFLNIVESDCWTPAVGLSRCCGCSRYRPSQAVHGSPMLSHCLILDRHDLCSFRLYLANLHCRNPSASRQSSRIGKVQFGYVPFIPEQGVIEFVTQSCDLRRAPAYGNFLGFKYLTLGKSTRSRPYLSCRKVMLIGRRWQVSVVRDASRKTRNCKSSCSESASAVDIRVATSLKCLRFWQIRNVTGRYGAFAGAAQTAPIAAAPAEVVGRAFFAAMCRSVTDIRPRRPFGRGT